MTKLAPARLGGFVMGMWFFSTAIGNFMAGRMASLYESMTLPTLFGTVALFAVGAAILLAVLIKPTVRLMSGVK
jgi:POT family proton-dependent oligopeptide transporter